MSILWTLFIILQTLSVVFASFVLFRLWKYTNKYKVPESHYTLLFGFIDMRMIMTVYAANVLIWIFVSYFLIARF